MDFITIEIELFESQSLTKKETHIIYQREIQEFTLKGNCH